MIKKQVVVGLGEIGTPVKKLISKNFPVLGYDVNPNLTSQREIKKLNNLQTSFLHICIPFSNKFSQNVLQLAEKFNPSIIVIHSTISPGTTKNLQTKSIVPVIYSATRGIHKRMIHDLRRYTKFFAIEKDAPNAQQSIKEYSLMMKKCGIKTKKMSNPLTLELAKIVVDTSYYGWLINYAQLSNMIASQYKVNYDEMWSFSDEIHKYLGNRPKMYPGYIGGHCVIPNLDLIHNQTLNLIKKINNIYLKKTPNAKKITKKYSKGKQSYNKK